MKAISIKSHQAKVETDRCINCGVCIEQCPQKAKRIIGSMDQVKALLESGNKVVASIAPSYGAIFPQSFNELSKKLQEKGFFMVEETAVGAEIVADQYKLIYQTIDDGQFVIASTCSVIKDYIQKYSPSLIKNLATVVSPMIAHGMLLKKKYGDDTKVVFIGPCIAKKEEATDIEIKGYVDEVFTFAELGEWLGEGFTASEITDNSNNTDTPDLGRWFPIPGGLLKTAGLNHSFDQEEIIVVDGINESIEMLKALEKGKIKAKFIEILACKSGCLGGPAINIKKNSFEKHQELIKCAMQPRIKNITDIGPLSLTREFNSKILKFQYPGEKSIREILNSIGKNSPEKELNCGSCGYPTCRDKAIAVFQGMAELEMCVPYMRDKAETVANLIIEATPNGILVVDNQMIIKEFNPSAETMFGLKSKDIKGKLLTSLMDDSLFLEVIEQEEPIKSIVEIPKYSLIVNLTVSYIKEEKLILGILTNITASEQQKQNLKMVKDETLQRAQEVINKQMRVAQEIAGLLGETTAESKVLLTRLIDIVKSGGDDDVIS